MELPAFLVNYDRPTDRPTDRLTYRQRRAHRKVSLPIIEKNINFKTLADGRLFRETLPAGYTARMGYFFSSAGYPGGRTMGSDLSFLCNQTASS